MKTLWRQFQRLDDDQSGAAMTEFAITLPIFLAFFALIGGLGNVVQGSIQAQTSAAPAFWSEVYAAEDDLWRMSARTEGFTRSTGVMDMYQNLSGGFAGGHWQESNHAVDSQMGIVTGQSIPSGVQDDPDQHVTSDPSDLIGTSRAAQGVSDDSLLPSTDSLTSPGTWGSVDTGGGLTDAIFDMALEELTKSLGIHLGFGAGVRYGDVSGGTETTIDPGYNLPQQNFSASYSSRVSPSPDLPDGISWMESIPIVDMDDPEVRAWATARIFVQTEDPYGNLFDIFGDDGCDGGGGGFFSSVGSFFGIGGDGCSGRDNRLDPNKSNEVPVVYDDHGSNPNTGWACTIAWWC